MSGRALAEARTYAKSITDALGGRGVFGVELFVKGDEVLFSEVSPRPHDTGMVTMISQDLSQFALHARAILVCRFRPFVNSVPLHRAWFWFEESRAVLPSGILASL